MKKQKRISSEEARRIGESLYLDWEQVDLEQFRQGLMKAHAQEDTDPETGMPYDGVLQTGKVVLAHMQEFPDYFTRLERLRAETEEYQARSR